MRTTLFHLLLIVLAVGSVFGQSVHDSFLSWDDEQLITDNPHVADGRLDGLVWHWRNPHEQLYIPVVYSVWWSIAASAGLDARFFHAANLLVFAADACLVYFILRKLVGRSWPALAGALLFALHPLQVEPVCWAVGMKDLLCTFFSLAAIAIYLLPRFYWAATLCFIAAMLCKPSAVTLPLILVALDALILHRRPRQIALRLGPWIIGAACIALMTSHVQPATNIAAGPLWARPLLAADTLDWYLLKLFWPSDMGIDHGHRAPLVMAWRIMGIPWIALAWIIPAALAALLIHLRKPILTFSALVFVLALLPELGIQAFAFQRYSTVADRYACFALLGPALAAAWLLSKWRHRAAFWTIVAGALALATDSFFQTQYWYDDVSLYQHAIDVNPNSYLCHFNLGVAYTRRGDQLDAKAEYRKAEEVVHQYPEAYLNLAEWELLGAAKCWNSGRSVDARRLYEAADAHFNSALKLDPFNSDARQGIEDARKGLDQMKSP